ncbi:MAG: hypothetical protein ABW222_16400 [Actinomycetota bacterium]
MDGFRPETYGDRIADVYDTMMADLPDPGDCVDRLAELAGPGPALELGIGTGRVALPLAARGAEVRYAWPSELDLMARLAGLRLRERWGGLAPGAVRCRQRAARLGLRARRGGRLVA